MCGIAGIIGHGADQKVLMELLKPIIRRGEMHYRYEVESIPGYGALGMHRLAIVDEEHGKQPIIDSERKIYCVFNGEIYNYEKIRDALSAYYPINSKCDSEIILYAYLNWGDDFVKHLDGMFAIAVFDVDKNKLLLTRDPMGIKPLYYSNVNGATLFSSELKSLVKQHEVERIYEVKPGTIWINNDVKSYFTLRKFPDLKNNDSLILMNQLKKSLISVVAKHIPKDATKIACLLSGGIDSSIITYLASKLHPHVVAYTLAAPNVPSEDLIAAKELTKALDIEHVIVTPSTKEMQQFYLDYGVYMTESLETILIRNAVSYYFLCRQVVNDGFKFCLNGEGADELFGGYDFVMEASEHNRDEVIWHSLSIIDKTYLQMSDRAAMFATLEARVPYMNEELVSFCLTLPSSYRIYRNKNKVALRSIFKEELPAITTERRKVGMNEGSGYGKNIPTDSIYYYAVKNYYDSYPDMYLKDLSICKKEVMKQSVSLDLNNIEEIYNFAKYYEFGYLKLVNGATRLQLNARLDKQTV